MKNRNIKKVIPYVLIISGIIIIAIALYQKISTTYYQNKLVDEYYKYISRLNFDDNIEGVVPPPESPSEESAAASREHEEERAEEPETPKEPDENPVEKYLQGKEISGIIEIPKLGVKAAILEGTDDTALKYTVGHYPGTGNPGKKGNYVLLGHRNYVYGHYFRRIDELKPRDEVVIKKDLETYTYTITESFVVSPEEVWVLEDTEEIMLTMITCTPVITYTDRLIVRGVISEQ
jgi:sortase A